MVPILTVNSVAACDVALDRVIRDEHVDLVLRGTSFLDPVRAFCSTTLLEGPRLVTLLVGGSQPLLEFKGDELMTVMEATAVRGAQIILVSLASS